MDTITEGYRRRQEHLLKTIHDQDKDLEHMWQLLERYYKLMDTWGINIAEHAPDEIYNQVTDEVYKVQVEVKQLLGLVTG